ncbi:MAG: hypothetical protein ACFFCP_07325 [Promethearchaeota archaeon]
MELGTFGAILKFAMETEENVAKFYKTVSDLVEDQNRAILYQNLFRRGEKRLKTLERVRRENVTEMILEPITGLDSENYKIEAEILSSVQENEIRDMALSLERTLYEFYTHAAGKIDFLIEVSYSFELLAEANEKAIQSLS